MSCSVCFLNLFLSPCSSSRFFLLVSTCRSVFLSFTDSLPHAFSTCVYCMLLCFQSSYIGWLNQHYYFENATVSGMLKTRVVTWLFWLFVSLHCVYIFISASPFFLSISVDVSSLCFFDTLCLCASLYPSGNTNICFCFCFLYLSLPMTVCKYLFFLSISHPHSSYVCCCLSVCLSVSFCLPVAFHFAAASSQYLFVFPSGFFFIPFCFLKLNLTVFFTLGMSLPVSLYSYVTANLLQIKKIFLTIFLSFLKSVSKFISFTCMYLAIMN